MTGSVPANGALTIRLDRKLRLGNDGDAVTLLDGAGKRVYAVSYSRMAQGALSFLPRLSRQ